MIMSRWDATRASIAMAPRCATARRCRPHRTHNARRLLQGVLMAWICCHVVGTAESTAVSSWAPCTGDKAAAGSECATLTVQLCYGRVCASNKTLDVPISRFVSSNAKAPTMVVLKSPEDRTQCPNGASLQIPDPFAPVSTLTTTVMSPSTAVGCASLKAFDGQVNVYVIALRGTRGVAQLQCAAHTPTNQLDVIASAQRCVNLLEIEYGNASTRAFSANAAARDAASLLKTVLPSTSVTVYAKDFATVIAKHLMRMPNVQLQINGYVLHNVFASVWSAQDVTFRTLGDQWIDLCASDNVCSRKFAQTSLRATMEQLIAQTNAESDAASIKQPCLSTLLGPLATIFSEKNATSNLRRLFAQLLEDANGRQTIAPLVYRLARCLDQDLDVISAFIYLYDSHSRSKPLEETELLSSAGFVRWLVTFSELWETPAPSVEQMQDRMTDTLISDDAATRRAMTWCSFTNATGCGAVYSMSPTTTVPWTYEAPELTPNISLSTKANVLVVYNRVETRETESDVLAFFNAITRCKHKQMLNVTFDTTGDAWTTTVVREIAAQVVWGNMTASGVIAESALTDQPESFSDMSLNRSAARAWLSVDDAYEGGSNLSIFDSSSTKSTPVALIVGVSVASVVVGGGVVAWFLWHRRTRREQAEPIGRVVIDSPRESFVQKTPPVSKKKEDNKE